MKKLSLLAIFAAFSFNMRAEDNNQAQDHHIPQVALLEEGELVHKPEGEVVTKAIDDSVLKSIGKLSTCSKEEIKPILEVLMAEASEDVKVAFAEILQNHEMAIAMFHDQFQQEISKDRVAEIAAIVHDLAGQAHHHDVQAEASQPHHD